MYWKTFFIWILLIGMPSGIQSQTLKKPVTLMGLGDSITEGSDHFSTYLCPLRQLLEAAHCHVSFIGPRSSICGTQKVRHCGFSGKNVEYLDSLIDSTYRTYPADIVLIHAGHNHFANEHPVEDMIAAYESIIRKLISIRPDVQIILSKVIPSGKLPKYSYIPALNREIGKLVKRMHLKQVSIADPAHGFDWRKYTIQDKVHPNEQGAEHIASAFMKALMHLQQ